MRYPACLNEVTPGPLGPTPFPGPKGPQEVAMPLFTVNTANQGETFVICIMGELDLSECPRLECALQEAETSRAPWVLLDLERLTFIDAAGLGVLVAAWRRSATDGNRLRVTPGRGDVAGMFCLTALDTVLPFVSSKPDG